MVSQIAASLVMLSAGTSYLFSMYGTQLSSILGFHQTQIAFIAASLNAGNYLSGPLVGHFVDHYPSQTSLFFLFGGSAIFAGYLSIGLVVIHEIDLHYLIIAALFFMIGMGTASSYHCSLATNYRNWPKEYGSLAVGFTVSFFGLSAFIFTKIGLYF